MARKERIPVAQNVNFPVFVPSTDGATTVEMGKADMRNRTLVIRFKDSLPAVAIQNMIQRGVFLGISFVMLAPDDVHIAAEERLEKEEQEAKDALILEGIEAHEAAEEEVKGHVQDHDNDEPTSTES